jgi:4-amino-4-deoxy-L-arabinose transferase-like glycosyltransferase
MMMARGRLRSGGRQGVDVAEREWREATDLEPATVWLAVVLVVAAVLRLWTPGHGIPEAVPGEEAVIIATILGIMRSGDFNPHAFDYPGLIVWLHLPVACARFLLGAIRGEWTSLDGVSLYTFLPWARIVTALVGTATVVLVHQATLRWGARHALLAAGLLAVLPGHVAGSHHAMTDVPLAFLAVLIFLLSLAASEKGTAKAFALAGAAAGLATGTDYSAIVMLALPLLAVWLTFSARPSRLICALAAAGAALLSYLIVAPYTILDLPGFLNGFAAFTAKFRARSDGGGDAWIAYLIELKRNLGWPALILMFAGLTMGGVRAAKGPGHVRWALLVAFPVMLYVLYSRRGMADARVLVPVLPFACILAALAVISGVSLLRRFSIPRAPRTALIVALTVAALLPPSIGSIAYLRSLGRPAAAAGAAGERLSPGTPAGAPTSSKPVIPRPAPP